VVAYSVWCAKNKVAEIVRDEMNKAGLYRNNLCQWSTSWTYGKESGRWRTIMVLNYYAFQVFLTNRDFVLGPTH